MQACQASLVAMPRPPRQFGISANGLPTCALWQLIVPPCPSAPSPPRLTPRPQAKKWALVEQTSAANGAQAAKPVGNACHNCFEAFSQGLKPEFEEWSKLVAAAKVPEVKERIKQALLVHSGAQDPAFARSAATADRTAQIAVQRHMLVLSDSELRAMLRVPRLLKSHTRELTAIALPSDEDLSISENLWCFSDPSKPYRTAVVTTGVGFTSQSQVLAQDRCIYDGQAAHFVQSAWLESESKACGAVAAKLPTVESFLASQGIKAPRKCAPTRRETVADEDDDDDEYDDDGDEGDASSDVALSGIAASGGVSVASFAVAPSSPRRTPMKATSKASVADSGSDGDEDEDEAGAQVAGSMDSGSDGDEGDDTDCEDGALGLGGFVITHR